ncbi:structural maintenance of chromosomes protein 5-like [Corticium candelabrum]|uniref:structural maintenance of chromosomes protein 5-like n=1 Tax=Corticium candelabrum TaxID=121492 RepID=UPI002E275DE5|nr:structural maintenance of chromosomes protein 5-like [Corticium candelabrum]
MAVYFKLVLEEIRVETFADKYSYFTSEINLLQLIPTSLVFAFKVAAWIEAKENEPSCALQEWDACFIEDPDYSDSELSKSIGRWETEIVSLEESLENVPPVEDINEQLETVVSDLRKVSSNLNRIMTERERIRSDEESVKRQLDNYKRQIQRLEDTRNQREEEMRKCSQHTYDALQWLRANQYRFKEMVIEPTMLVVTVKDPAKAKFVEAAIPFRDMTSFVCQNTEDLHLFVQETRERQGLKINAVQPPAEDLSDFKPKKKLIDLKKFGFQSYLIDLIEAPNAVLRYLCKTCYIHDTPLGNDQTDMNVSCVADQSGLIRFFTPTSSCSVKQSKYGLHDKSTRISRVRSARFLDVQMDMERHRELLQQCQELRQESQQHGDRDRKLQVDEEGLRKQESDLRQQKKDLSTKKGLKKKVEMDIQTRRKRIEESNTQDAIDLKREELKMRQSMRKINEKRVQLAALLQGIMEDCRDVVLKRIRLAFRHAQLANESEMLQAAQRDAISTLKDAEDATSDGVSLATGSKLDSSTYSAALFLLSSKPFSRSPVSTSYDTAGSTHTDRFKRSCNDDSGG